MVKVMLLFHPNPREKYEFRKLLIYKTANDNGVLAKNIEIYSLRIEEKQYARMIKMDIEGDIDRFVKYLREKANYEVYIESEGCKVINDAVKTD